MALHEVRRNTNQVTIADDTTNVEVIVVPLNAVETDYLIDPITKQMYELVDGVYTQFDFAAGSGNVIDTFAATLGAGNITGGNDIVMSSGDLITDDGTGGGVNLLSTGGAGINLQTPALAGVNCQTPQFQVQDLASNLLFLAKNSGASPQVTLGYSSSGNGSRLYLNDVTKSLTMTTDTADLEVGINGAAETGYGLKVTGSIKATSAVVCNILTDITGAVTLDMSVADTMLLTASAGVQVTGGFGSTANSTKAANYALTPSDNLILTDASANTVEITVGTSFAGQEIWIKCGNIDFATTVETASGTYTFLTSGDAIVVRNIGSALEIFAQYKQ